MRGLPILKILAAWGIPFIGFMLFGCRDNPGTPAIFQTSSVGQLVWPTNAWPASSPEAQGMDSSQLAAMLAEIEANNYRIDSVTIIRNGVLVLDAYHFPFKSKTAHIIHSCTKSIVSALIGIAIHEGYIEGTQQQVLSFFPDREVANLDLDKKNLTLEHLLTMTAGYDSRDSYLYRWEGLEKLRRSQDWVSYVIDLPMAAHPGTQFEYCNSCSFLLSAIIQETTGLSAFEYAQEHLFQPLGITDVVWPATREGINIGWGEMHLRPLDMAKIGYLFLKGGMWDGQQIIPSDWVAVSTKKHIAATLEDGYGYQWWVDDSGYYMALGYAGQFIFVFPEKEMVVVFTSDLPEVQFYTPQQLLETYIFPAAMSSEPLSENPKAVMEMENQREILSKP